MINRGHSKHINKSFENFGYNKKGFIFPINLYLGNVYEIKNDFQLIAVILKKP